MRFRWEPAESIRQLAVHQLGWLPKPCHQRTPIGFTLAELLISLAILGVIATFTIPKVLQSQQTSSYNSAAKEVIAMVSQAYQTVKLNGQASLSTKASDLTPYMNYVAVDTSTPVDDWQTGTTWGCSSTVRCLKLHNGGILAYDLNDFTYRSGGTTAGDVLIFAFDPDGKYSGTTNGPGKALTIVIYPDGGVNTHDNPRPNSWYSGTASVDPPWFSWN